MLIDKYQPKTLDDVKLADDIFDPVIAWANSYLNELPDTEKPALLLYGFPGIGKTTIARCLCNDCGWHIIELNASDVRNKKTLSQVKPSTSLFSETTCIVLDEADSFDEQSEGTIKSIIKSNPTILTANNINKVPKTTKFLCTIIQMKRPSFNSLKSYLKEIIRKENLNISPELIDFAAHTQDFRLALNIIESGTELRGAVRKITLKENTKSLLIGEYSEYDDTNSLIYYLEENCVRLYNPFDLNQMYEILALSDSYKRRGQMNYSIQTLKLIPKTTVPTEDIEILTPALFKREQKRSKK